MKRIMTSFLAGAALLALTAAPAAAQSTEVGGGFAIQNWNGCCAYGFAADVAQAFYRSKNFSIAGVGDFGWTRFTGEESDSTVVGGVRFKFLRDRPVSLFAQGTTGMVHWSEDATAGFSAASGNYYIVGGGGGVQIRLNEMIDIKGQVDVWEANNSDIQDWDTIYRYTFGAVFKFGKK